MDPLTKEDGIINDIGRVMAAKRISENGSLMVCCRDIIYEKDLYRVHGPGRFGLSARIWLIIHGLNSVFLSHQTS